MAQNQYDAIIIGGGGVSGAKAACSIHGSPWGLSTRVRLSGLLRTEAGIYPTITVNTRLPR